MSMDISIADVKPVNLTIASSGAGVDLVINLEADWLALDSLGLVINFISQKKDSESKLFSAYPQNVRDAIVVLDTYVTNRIKAGYGI